MTVKIPMMPKGVEHEDPDQSPPISTGVKIPMMPKGVEHMPSSGFREFSLRCEDSNDAERR